MGDHLIFTLEDGRLLLLWVDDYGKLRFRVEDPDDEAAIGTDGIVADPAALGALKVWVTDRARLKRGLPARAATEPHDKGDTVPIWRATDAVVPGYRVHLGDEVYEVGEEAQPGDVLYLIEGKLGHWPGKAT